MARGGPRYEQDAKEKGIAYEVTQYGIDDRTALIADGTAHGFVSADGAGQRLHFGRVTIVGEHAAI
ncbi:MAG: hypothetical protein IPH54_07500 [Rhodoferax sp.]|nr:hypothetical protein [Rhodoferax sp.]